MPEPELEEFLAETFWSSNRAAEKNRIIKVKTKVRLQVMLKS